MAVSHTNSKSINLSSHLETLRFSLGFSAKPKPEIDPLASPTSILETKLFSPSVNLFLNDMKQKPTWHTAESKAVGLGIVDALCNEKPDIHRKCCNPDGRMVLFGSQLKIQIPPMKSTSVSWAGCAESPRSPIEFGVKNKNSQLGLLYPAPSSPMAGLTDMWPPLKDMELSEDYTRVISHGPNPRTTHILDNCIVESYCTSHRYAPSTREKNSLADDSCNFPAFCLACKKSPGLGKDIFVYRGGKALCSNDCQHHVVMFDGGMEMESSGSSMIL